MGMIHWSGSPWFNLVYEFVYNRLNVFEIAFISYKKKKKLHLHNLKVHCVGFEWYQLTEIEYIFSNLHMNVMLLLVYNYM